MTRPKKGESLIKTKDVHLRMSETEYEILSEKAIATNMSISDFIRNALNTQNVIIKYEITAEMKEKLGDFYGNYATQEECAAQIRSLYEDTDYVLDPHTAVAAAVYNKYKEETGDTTKTVIASTASPYKFTRTVMSAMDEKYADMDDFALTEELEKISGVKIPDAITKIRNAPVLHNIQCEKDGMKQAVMEFLEKQ